MNITGIDDKKLLLEWMRENRIEDDLLYRDSAVRQMYFYRDRIHPLVINAKSLDEYEANPPCLISTHVSKSIELPVYYSEGPALRIIARDNFYDWKVSAVVERSGKTPTDDMLGLLIEPDSSVNSIYCEGFKDEWVFGSITIDPNRFSVEIADDYRLWAFVYLLGKICYR